MNSLAKTIPEWLEVCHLDDLVMGSGVAVLVKGKAVAIFAIGSNDFKLYAISHKDPFSNADVLAHGIVCEGNGVWTVASPIYKQHFRLDTGECLEDPTVKVNTWPIRLRGNLVEINTSDEVS